MGSHDFQNYQAKTPTIATAQHATVDIILERRKLELEIKLLKRAPLKDRTVIGWFFYGWAAS